MSSHPGDSTATSCRILTRSSKRKLGIAGTAVDQGKPSELSYSNDRAIEQELRKYPKKCPRKKNTGRSRRSCGTDLSDMPADVLEHIACFLDTKSSIALLQTSKLIYSKLLTCGTFWKHLCRNENFHEYASLKVHDPYCDPQDSESDGDVAKFRKVEKGRGKKLTKYYRKKSDSTEIRTSYDGEALHAVKIPKDSTLWRKIFLRGLQMRRNICDGRFEVWRLFLTGSDNLPLKKMTHETSNRELRSIHRGSPYNNPKRRVGINRYWNEDYLIAIQQSPYFTDVFVWGWNECQNAKFLYTHDFKDLYPNGFFPTAYFLWKHYLVLMPDSVNRTFNEKSVRSMIRVHDLEQNMKLVGSYDFPKTDTRRRIVKASIEFHNCNDVAHLHKVQDKAVALCWAPKLTLFIFSLPDCQLLTEVPLQLGPEFPLDQDELDQRFVIRDNTLIFMLHDKDFFASLYFPEEEPVPHAEKFGRVLFVDLERFLIDNKNPVEIRVDNNFDSNFDYIEKVAVVNKNLFVLVLNSGKVVLRDIVSKGQGGKIEHVDRLVIPCPEPLMSDFDTEFDEDAETDGPVVCLSRNGEMLVVMRHFETGRRIHAYDLLKSGSVIYQINLDHSMYDLCLDPGYVSVDMDGNFLCAADLEKIVIWNSKTGNYIRTIKIPSHYKGGAEKPLPQDSFAWKGHTDFAFAEDGVIIIHSKQNFPIAADILLFW